MAFKFKRKKRYVHDLSNYAWASLKAGELTPVKCMEILPNTTVKLRSEAILRCDAMARPTQHPLKVKLFHFYNRNQNVWPNWNTFINGGAQGTATPVRPYFDLSDVTGGVGTLPNRLGLPLIDAGGSETGLNALPLAHTWQIYTKFFADPQIQTEIPVVLTDGDNTANIGTIFGTSPGGGYTVPYVNWKKDYFNTARIDPQVGAAVPIPQSEIEAVAGSPGVIARDADNLAAQTGVSWTSDGTGKVNDGTEPTVWDPNGSLAMDDSATMRDLSIAGALQRWKENIQETGTRIIDYLRSRFDSSITSYELNEPVLINWGEKTVRFSEVLQTAEGTDPVGTLRGHGVGGFGSNYTKFTTKEHGFIITFAVIIPEPAYLNNAERFWFKENQFDYFTEEFEAIGEQAILEKEIGFGKPANTGIFGYTHPYDEYRRCLNTVSGTYATTDKNWHMVRDPGVSVPALVPAFLIEPPTQRVFDDTSGEVYKLFMFHECIARSVVKRHVKKRIL